MEVVEDRNGMTQGGEEPDQKGVNAGTNSPEVGLTSGQGPFKDVHEEDHDPGLGSQGAKGIGGADVPTAQLADVLVVEELTDPEARGDGPQQVGDDDHDDNF